MSDTTIEVTCPPTWSCVRRSTALVLVLTLLTGGFGLLFAALLVPSASSCQLTYDTAGVITEDEMRVWASRADWTLTHPTYDSVKRACTCSADADPTAATTKTPVWIAPGDIVTLFESTLPASFVKKYKSAFAPEDHVKVCLAQDKLTELWNRGNCHQSNNTTGGVDKIFTGWDGDLYCSCSSLDTLLDTIFGSKKCNLWDGNKD